MCLINAVTVQVDRLEKHMSGNATNQELGPSCDKTSPVQ